MTNPVLFLQSRMLRAGTDNKQIVIDFCIRFERLQSQGAETNLDKALKRCRAFEGRGL